MSQKLHHFCFCVANPLPNHIQSSVLTPHWLSSLFFYRISFFALLDSSCKHLSSSESRGWRKEPWGGGWGSSGCVEGEKWQGFHEGGITQWAGSPAGGGIDGYLNRPGPKTARLALQWARSGLSFCQEVICGGGGGEEEGEGGEELSDWLDNAKTHMHIQTHSLSQIDVAVGHWAGTFTSDSLFYLFIYLFQQRHSNGLPS